MKTTKLNNLKSIFTISLLVVTSLSVSNCAKDTAVTDTSTTDSSSSSSTSTSTTSGAELQINNYVQIATGQVKTYNNSDEVTLTVGDTFYGQDGNIQKGAVMSYTDNGDKTVTDNNTGLMWQQIPSSNDYTWQEAVDYCNSLSLGGHDDWRIPSAKELYSIANFGTGWPYIDTTYFHLASGQVTKDEQFWTSNYYVGTTVEGGSNAAFGVNAVTGHIKAYAAQAGGPVGGKYVRAVRGAEYGTNDFVDNGDFTITDKNSGLMWTQNDSGEGLDWEHALSYAVTKNSENYLGHNDWRLPNVKELQGIVDYSRSPSATDATKVGPAINTIFNSTPITNEAGDSDYGYYWTSTSANFTSGEPYYYAWYVAFGRAVNAEGLDFHGAGGVRFDTKVENGPLGEGGERYYNYVRLVRDAK